MPIELFRSAESNLLEIQVSGTVVKEDYTDFVSAVDELVTRFGTVRMLMVLHEFHGWTTAAAWEDLKFDINHYNAIGRIAIVGESTLEHIMTTVARLFNRAEIQYFDRSQLAEARSWIES